jgi:putative endonuclease
MAWNNELGKRGEQMAADLLRNKGYVILERNWTSGRLEIDIIARDGKDIVFVEVKTRADDELMRPEDAVDFSKRCNLTKAASHYIQQKHIDLNPRFDVVAIVINSTRSDINHIVDAFYPVARKPRRRY